MATFSNNDVLLADSRTELYHADGVTAIVFSGVVANVDTASQLDQYVTLERRKDDGVTYSTVFERLAIAYGASQAIPKLVLKPGERLFANASTGNSNKLNASINVVEL